VTAASLPRRQALRAAAVAALSYSRIAGANDRIQLGVAGCGGRGIYVMKRFQAEPGVEVAAVCDVYGERVDKAQQAAPGAKGFSDHRALLGHKPVDAVLVGTPDHWHKDITIDALNAGKDVYVEKPLTLRMDEGPEIVKAARMNNRICQVGMQQRSGPQYIRARDEILRPGKLGKVTLVRTWWPGGPARPLRPPVVAQPSNLDWARYLGPVRWRDWNPAQYFNYRAFLDFGGGKITDLFTHWVDVVHMLMGQDDPVSAAAAGGIYHYKDGRTAPDTIHLLLEYRGEFTVTFESPALGNLPEYHVEFCGTEGRLWINRSKYEWRTNERGAPPVVVRQPTEITDDHVRNFLDCCRSRKLPNGDVYLGHRSAQASHLGVLAYVQKRRIRFDPDREAVLPL